ncbi:hypothetical protein RUM43_002445 [Polyplax serrata]|uniref:Uncharacterized protein n=1 Tax=Polyplax serrata TaxID=468196 RepID=A0AAN8P2A1_POLSC
MFRYGKVSTSVVPTAFFHVDFPQVRKGKLLNVLLSARAYIMDATTSTVKPHNSVAPGGRRRRGCPLNFELKHN